MVEEEKKLQNKKIKQLLIIGNGADKHLGLPSLYLDYYNSLTYVEKFSNLLTGLATNQTYNWADVESLLLKILVVFYYSDASDLREALSPSEQILSVNNYEKFGKTVIKNAIYNRMSLEEIQRIRTGTLKFLIEHRWFEFSSRNTSDEKAFKKDKEKIYKHIMNQVTEFENQFKSYLQTKVKEFPKDEYEKKSKEFIDFLLKAGVYLPNNDEYDNRIISFNYTPIFEPKRVLPFYVTNVHGKLEGEVILGIDAHENAKFMEFTKTYRIMTQNDNGIMPTFDKDIDKIKFYGHSLGEADYSYFISIFDAVDLYGSSVQLIFYYNDFEGHEGTAHKREQVSAVYKLINHYGTTFQNQEHGKNLLHKLVLERRISVIKPEDDMLYI